MIVVKTFQEAIKYIGRECICCDIPFTGTFNIPSKDFEDYPLSDLYDVFQSYKEGLQFIAKDDFGTYQWKTLLVFEEGETL